MSVTRIVYVHCDGCGDTVPDMADKQMTAAEQRRDLHEAGWVTRKGGLDYCEECKAR